ncbi:hypothetical protein ACPCTO_03665 [Streptomyces olivoreticuli]
MNSSDVDIERMRTAIGRLLDHDNRHGGDAIAATAVQVWRTGRRKLDRGLIPDGSHAEYVSTVAEVAQIAG